MVETLKDNYDDEDVSAALAKTDTADGDGPENELPESDFDGFPEDEVENNHDGDNEPAVEGYDK